MKMPKYMIEKMKKANTLISDGNDLIKEISDYLLDKGVTDDTIYSVQGELDFPHNSGCVERILNLLDKEE